MSSIPSNVQMRVLIGTFPPRQSLYDVKQLDYFALVHVMMTYLNRNENDRYKKSNDTMPRANIL